MTDGEVREFVADGHDAASSIGLARWRTPSGAVLIEGARYRKEWRVKFRPVVLRGEVTQLALRGGWHVVSESLD